MFLFFRETVLEMLGKKLKYLVFLRFISIYMCVYIIYIFIHIMFCMFLFWFFKYLFLFIQLAVSGLSCTMQTLGCGRWDLVSWPGTEPGPPALGAESHSHWTTKEVPDLCVLKVFMNMAFQIHRRTASSKDPRVALPRFPNTAFASSFSFCSQIIFSECFIKRDHESHKVSVDTRLSNL